MKLWGSQLEPSKNLLLKIREGHSKAHIFEHDLVHRDHVQKILRTNPTVHQGNPYFLVLLSPRIYRGNGANSGFRKGKYHRCHVKGAINGFSYSHIEPIKERGKIVNLTFKSTITSPIRSILARKNLKRSLQTT